MSKDSRSECPDCARLDISGASLFGSKGNGRCSRCDGTGETYDAITGIVAPILDLDPVESCKICYGTGQCQTCGGTGYIYYSEEDSYRDNSRETSSYEPSSSSEYDSYTTGDGDDNGCVAGGIGLVIVIIVCVLGFRTCQSNNDSNQQYTQQQLVQPVVPQIEACESKNTGDYSFDNKTERTLYLFITSGVWWKRISIPPHQNIIEYEIPADNYHYECSYFNQGNFDNNDIEGDIKVEQCKSKNLELSLPKYEWYDLPFNVWQEFDIPKENSYAVVAPFRNFSIRFYEGDIEHYASSYVFLPDSTTKIFLKSPYKHMEVSIQLYHPREIPKTFQ